MRVLLIGAYGFIGSALAGELILRGHEVTGLGRDCAYGQRILPKLTWVAIDLAQMTTPESWNALLEGHDTVINASGLLQDGDGGSVQAVQFEAVRGLVAACEAAGIKRFVQISAAGARMEASSHFMSTKARADAVVGASAIPSLILRPGLVIGRNSYGGTELVRNVAAVPIAPRLPFSKSIQCIALSDVVEAVIRNIERDDMRTGSFDLVERRGRSLGEIIAVHRQWLGLPKAQWSMEVPGWLLKIVGSAADLLGIFGWRSPLRTNALNALDAGVVGDPTQARDLLQQEPLSLEETLAQQPAGKQDRLHARLGLVQPLIIATLFIMWGASGVATLLQLDRAAAIMTNSGVDKDLAYAIAIGGGWLDIILAAGLLWRRTIRPILLTMIVITIVVYLIGGTILVPDLWVDPLAPFAKALPATLLALITFWMVEKR